MLKGLSPLLDADVLHLLAAMGHGDEVVIADANFPAVTVGRRVVRLSGAGAPAALRAVLSVLPLDASVERPAAIMAPEKPGSAEPPATRELLAVLRELGGAGVKVEPLSRDAFYARAGRAFGVIATGETRTYGNMLLKKGVVATD